MPAAQLWSLLLLAVPLPLAVALSWPALARPDIVIAGGLAVFGLPFAVNSSLHSHLILAYAAIATGRLLGMLLSGLLSQMGGMTACLLGSPAMLDVDGSNPSELTSGA